MMFQLRPIFGAEAVDTVIQQKLNRLEGRLNEEHH
jgi:hypothetical protein